MKRALITGGSGAIGAAICRQLAQDGFAVIVHANRNLDAAESLATSLSAEGYSAEAIQFDVFDA
ncbi:MAG: 3-oxoacyl-(acyl-carrier protein) reductase, partial [Pseudomonadota bacterium]